MNRSADILRVCVDARLSSGRLGGVEQVLIGLASGLSKLTDGDEEYLFLVHADADGWIRPYIQGPCRILRGTTTAQARPPGWKQFLISTTPVVRDMWYEVWYEMNSLVGREAVKVPRSDGTIEKANVDVIHFPKQDGFLTDVPSIYHPWDLQHIHLPQFFTSRQFRVREVTYRAFCEQATVVATASSWGKKDLIRHYGLSEEKVQVVPVAPVLDAYPIPTYEDLEMVRKKYSLPDSFIFYPAQTWPHKNHIGLLKALNILRSDYGLVIPLVCSGNVNDFFPKLERKIRKLRLADQVLFLGFVSPLELQCLYKLCQFMVFPSKFEGWGLPVTEAFLAGAPVACSNVTSLPDLAGDAALIFDPHRPEEIADAVLHLWSDEALRSTLIARGKKNVERFTWDRTARIFRAHYRQIADRPLTEEDRALLAAPPLL